MKILIIEDEPPARAKLEEMLFRIDPQTRVVGQVGSVKDALRWLTENEEPELALVDVQLSDDHSFEIFRQRPVQFPVIFTTAYDKYLLESFEFNSIDYLLKPITEEKLKRAITKVRRLKEHFQKNILDLLTTGSPGQRIVARKGAEFVTLTVDDIAFLFTEHKMVFVKDFAGRQMTVDKNMSEWESTLDPKQFFRINRKVLANIKAIDRFKPEQGRIRIYLKPELKEEIYVSKEVAPAFRKWAQTV